MDPRDSGRTQPLMHAHARVHVERETRGDGVARTRIRRLRSEGALVLKPTRETLPGWFCRWNIHSSEIASVRVVAGAAGPLGGDHWRLDVQVGEGATLMLGAVAATLILPGSHGEESSSEVNISVADGGTLVWRPGIRIAAEHCRHVAVSRIELAEGARLFAREETLLGRHGESPGRFRQRLRVTRRLSALYDQELAVGPDSPGWRGAAVTGGRHALGSIVVVDPAATNLQCFKAETLKQPDTAVMPISDNACVISALAADALELRTRLDAAFHPFGQVRGPHSTSIPQRVTAASL